MSQKFESLPKNILSFCLLDDEYLNIIFLFNGEKFCHHNIRNLSETKTNNNRQLSCYFCFLSISSPLIFNKALLL